MFIRIIILFLCFNLFLSMKKILLFASGSGSNVENIIRHFNESNSIQVIGVFCNNSKAKVIDKAQKNKIPTFIFAKTALYDGTILDKINHLHPDLIVLAGFLLQFPQSIIVQYPNKIINVHPALLPKYGGKGMYGIHVHQAVIENVEKESGITIHYVNENYDEGEFIFQQSVNIEDCKTAEEIANKIQFLEHQYFPMVIEKLITNH
jgi:phosphoribosylglycinamide formyltransferase 1